MRLTHEKWWVLCAAIGVLLVIFLLMSANNNNNNNSNNSLHMSKVASQPTTTHDPKNQQSSQTFTDDDFLGRHSDTVVYDQHLMPDDCRMPDDPAKCPHTAPSTPPGQPTHFVIAALPRSGSRWLVDQLNSHPSIHCESEVHRKNNGRLTMWINGYWKKTWTKLKQRQPKPSAIGFKMLYNQGLCQHIDVIPSFFCQNSVKVVHLVRRNKLREIISRTAQMYGRELNKPGSSLRDHGGNVQRLAHVAHPQNVNDVEQILAHRPALHGDGLLVDIRRMRDQDIVVRRTFLDGWIRDGRDVATSPWYLEVEYERLVEDTTTELVKIQRFLDIDASDVRSQLSTDMLRIHDAKLVDLVSNAAEVEELLRDSEFAWMLDGLL